MKLSRFFKIMGFMTFLAVIYIHMQMQILDLAYQSNNKEQSIKKLIEANGDANYKILMMKSANHLGAAMLDEDTGMQFADSDDIVTIAASENFLEKKPLGGQSVLAKKANPFVKLLSFGVSEAKAAK